MSKKKGGSRNYLATLRNIGIIAHIDAGKTTLTERMLFYSGRIHRMGEVHDGTATMDFMPEEQERGITITSACSTFAWRDCQVNIIDTPGHVDFTMEVQRSLRVLDGAVGVFCAVSGVEPQSETVWRQSENYGVPKLAFINKLDRPGADFEAVLQEMRDKLKATPILLSFPIGQGPELEAVIDLLSMRKLLFDQDSLGVSVEVGALSEAEAEAARPWREKLLEALAENDDELLELYLAGEDIPEERLKATLRAITLGLKGVPVLVGSALRNIGVQPVMDAVCDYLPSPADIGQVAGLHPETHERKTMPADPNASLAALAFKVSLDSGRKLVLMRLYSGRLAEGDAVFNATQGAEERVARLFRLHAGRKEQVDEARAGEIVAAAGMKLARTGDTLCRRDDPILLERISGYKPVISLAIEPRSADQEEKLDEALGKYLLEDPTLALERDKETGQIVLSGMGELHLEVVLERLKREWNLEPRVGNPQVVYQETISARAEAEGEFSRLLGEVAHHGRVRLEVEPLPRGAGNEVVMAAAREGVPQVLVDAAAEGVTDGLQGGVLKGYPVQDVRVRVLELSSRPDSTSAGFRMAAASALRSALAKASPSLLEPIMWLEIYVPGEFIGDVIGLLGAKGGKIENMFDRAGQKVVQALTPMSQLFGFSTQLRSSTQGRAGLLMKFHRFDTLS